MTQFTVRHDVFESNSSNRTMFVATRALVKSNKISSTTQFRTQRTLQELFMTITFHSEGGTSEYNSVEALVGDKITELPEATRGTYLFDGWYTSAVGGTKVTTDTIVSSTIEHLYAHWIAATVLTFNPNGGTISGSTTINAYVGYPLNIKGSTFPTATGPSDKPNCIGFYTATEGGSKIEEDTIYDGSYSILYPHYAAQSYSVDLKGQWFKDDGSGVDPKGNSYALQYTTNPDAILYDGTYVSYSNWHVGNGYSVMRINLIGYDEFTIYLRSYAESNYDYAIAGNIDQAITSGSPSSYKARTYGNQ